MTRAIIVKREGAYVITAAGAELAASLAAQSRIARDRAEVAASASEVSAAYAESMTGPTYADTSAGLAATTDGQGFAVDNGDGTVTIYLNDGGSAVEQRTLATTTALGSSTGGAMVVTSRDNSVESELTWARAATPASINEFYDAGNGAAAERMALEAAAASGRAVSWRGTLTMDQQPDLPAHTTLVGEGSTSDNGTRGNTCIVRGFAGAEPLLLLQPDTTLRNIDVDGDSQGTGDNIQIVGERVVLDNVSTRKSGGRGVWIGDLDNDTMNANCWSIFALKSIYNAGAGLYIHQTNSDIGGDFPQGAPNVNAGSMFGADLRSNGGHGIHLGNSFDNKFYGVTLQNNAGRNLYIDDNSLGHCFYGLYTEEGGLPIRLEDGSKGNRVLGLSAAVGETFQDAGIGNEIEFFSKDANRAGFWRSVAVMPSLGAAQGGSLDLYDSVNLSLAAQIFGEPTGTGSQGKGVAFAKENGNVPRAVFEWLDTVGINILLGGLQVGGTQVVGAQQAAIPNSGDATTNAILAALRAHGLIAES